MNSTFEIIFGLLGGLALFLFGMNMMSDCLQKAAGDKMRKILALLTKNPVLGVLAGALTTAVLQSSSATTVMASGFVSAGLMKLPQGISIILGANIGTTMTAQLLAFKISDYIFVIIFIGFIISFITKSEKVKAVGETIFAFGLLFLGIETMGDVMEPLASSPVFTDMISRVADVPVLGAAVGTLMTLVVQSSSATIAVLQNFASQAGPDGVTSIIGLSGAIPILLGDNIGTTITAVLASITQSRDAKRTALSHCIFNISGFCIFIWFIEPFAKFIQWISPKGPEVEVISRQIANAHTAFNCIMTLIWLPMIWLLVKIVVKIIPDGKKGMQLDPYGVKYLDNRLISQPAAALELVAKEVLHCGHIVQEMLGDLSKAVSSDDRKRLDEVRKKSAAASDVNQKIQDYLADLFSGGVLTEEQAAQTAGIMYVLGDIDRIGFLTKSVADSMGDSSVRKFNYSGEAMKDLKKSLESIEDIYSDTLKIMVSRSKSEADSIRRRKEEVLDLDLDMRKAHLERVSRGNCDASLTAPFNSILHNIDRMSNSCVNIAEAALGQVDFNYFINIKVFREEIKEKMQQLV